MKGRHPKPTQQTCRVHYCQKTPEIHTTIRIEFGHDNAPGRLVHLGLDLCEQHYREMNDTFDNSVEVLNERARPWEPYNTPAPAATGAPDPRPRSKCEGPWWCLGSDECNH